jgi:hypothetical protein
MEQDAAGGKGLGARERGEPSAEGATQRGDTGEGSPARRAAEPPTRERDARQKSAEDFSEGRRANGDRKAVRSDRRADDNGKGGAENSARRDKSEKSADKTDDAASSDKADKPDRTAKEVQDTATRKNNDPGRSEKAERVKHVDLSGGKRDRVQSAFRDKPDIKRRTDVDIDISVGRRMPRDWHFYPVPVAVIEVVPEYRDYVFVYVEDEYVICDPDTYEVVAVVPASGGGSYARAGDTSCSTRIRLDDDQRELILRSVRLGREVDVADLEVGWSVPGDIELSTFPSAVLSAADELSACRYFIADDQLAVVDPEEDKVVLLIDKS